MTDAIAERFFRAVIVVAIIIVAILIASTGTVESEDPLEKIQREAVERGFARWETSTRMVWIGKFFVPQTTKTFKWSGDE